MTFPWRMTETGGAHFVVLDKSKLWYKNQHTTNLLLQLLLLALLVSWASFWFQTNSQNIHQWKNDNMSTWQEQSVEPTTRTNATVTSPTTNVISASSPSSLLQGPFYRNRSTVPLSYNSTVQFIITIGLEGTGHHLMGMIAEQSPVLKLFKRNKLWPNKAKELQRSIYLNYSPRRGKDVAGLVNAHCAPDKDPAMLQEQLVGHLRDMEAQVQKAIRKEAISSLRTAEIMSTTTGGETNSSHSVNWNASMLTMEMPQIPFPINSLEAGGEGPYGELSYPNFVTPCRPLNYPDLNLIYDACEQAQVDCLQVYIYRHPLEIFLSTLRRSFITNDTSAMQLYITDLHVIASQLRIYANKTLGCFGFFESDEDELYWIHSQQDLWGFNNETAFQEMMERIYKAPASSKLDKQAAMDRWIYHSKHGPYMKALWNVHSHTLGLCQRAVKGV